MSTPSPSASAPSITGGSLPPAFKIVGVLLAVASGFLIGSSFVFKKKGLLRSQAGHVAGEGVAYLKSPLWWTGMTMMILGELCNFAAYAFVEALVVTPLGALSVVICAILSSIFLKETLSFFGWLGCALCILGSVIIALNTPPEATIGYIEEFQTLFLAPGFLAWGGFLIAGSLTIILYFGPKYGKESMLWYIGVCSMIGGLSVSVTTGLGAAIVTTVMGQNQFKFWFIYFLLGFVVVTLVTEVLYLNKALALFNTAMVTPTYYVIFTFCTLVTTIILFQGLKASASQIITLVMGFLVICVGITILQMSKVDPKQLSKLDRRSTMLLQAARAQTETTEKNPFIGMEEPGVDSLRGISGAVGSIMRARSARRLSMRTPPANATSFQERATDGMQRHQLYDPPMSRLEEGQDDISLKSQPAASPGGRTPTIRFQQDDVRHFYPSPGAGRGGAVHQTTPRPGMPAGESQHAIFQTPPRLPPSREISSPKTAPPRLAEEDEDEEDNRFGSVARKGRKGNNSSLRGYPGGKVDSEESISLVEAAAPGPVSASDSDAALPAVGSVRLVPPRPGMI